MVVLDGAPNTEPTVLLARLDLPNTELVLLDWDVVVAVAAELVPLVMDPPPPNTGADVPLNDDPA